MPGKIYVVGHKNPNTDSTVSAPAYAELLRQRGVQAVVPSRQGGVWRETRYILDRFGMPLPVLLSEVRPCACDVMITESFIGHVDESSLASRGSAVEAQYKLGTREQRTRVEPGHE
jgi:hypothetical protein